MSTQNNISSINLSGLLIQQSGLNLLSRSLSNTSKINNLILRNMKVKVKIRIDFIRDA